MLMGVDMPEDGTCCRQIATLRATCDMLRKGQKLCAEKYHRPTKQRRAHLGDLQSRQRSPYIDAVNLGTDMR